MGLHPEPAAYDPPSKRKAEPSLPWTWIATILLVSIIAIIAVKSGESKRPNKQNAFTIGGRHFERNPTACMIDRANLNGRVINGPCSEPWVSYDEKQPDLVHHVIMFTAICRTCSIEYQYAGPVGIDPRTTLYWRERQKISEPLAGAEETFWCLRGVPECHAYIDVNGVFWTLQVDRKEWNPMALYRMAKAELEEMAK